MPAPWHKALGIQCLGTRKERLRKTSASRKNTAGLATSRAGPSIPAVMLSRWPPARRSRHRRRPANLDLDDEQKKAEQGERQRQRLVSRRRPLCCLLLLSQARPSGELFRIINPVRHREQRARSCRRVLDIPWKGCAPICPHADRKSDGRWPFPGLTAPACPLRQLWQAGAAPPTATSPSRGPTQSGPLPFPPLPRHADLHTRGYAR